MFWRIGPFRMGRVGGPFLLSLCSKPTGRLVILGCLVSVLVAQSGCGERNQAAANTRSTHPSPRPAVVGSTPVPASLALADFSCRLPVSGFAGAPGGVVSFPAASYAPEVPENLPSVTLLPDLGDSYDQPLRRWLPVRREQVAPDGSAYAYVNFPNRSDGPPNSDGVHVIDAASGQQRLLVPNRPQPALPWFITAYDSGGIYLSGRYSWSGGHQESVPAGLWLLDPKTGSVQTLTESESWLYVGGGAAWGITAPLRNTRHGAGSKLLRLDLRTGSIEVWLTKDIDYELVGVDASGHPLVELNSETALRVVEQPQLWLMSARDQVIPLAQSPRYELPQLLGEGTALEDSHGIWITGVDADLWLYRPRSGLQLLYRFADGATRSVAGPCG